MKVLIQQGKAEMPLGTEEAILERVHFALARLSHRIQTLQIRLDDLNGPRGGMDKRCVMEAVLAHRNLVYVKGAVERVIERCATMLQADGAETQLDQEAVRRLADEMASQGLRVLAFARRHVSPEQRRLTHDDVASGLTLLGLQGMIDPPRPEAVEAVRCQSAGISVKMITGDHVLTAKAIAAQVGLSAAGDSGTELVAVSGRDLDRLSDAELSEEAERAAVFARVAPEQKLRLVQALQVRGHVVAMTGDGVNDAPALKQADIGIAMGITGTDVAKGDADMLLTDDNFASIEAAVEEGRNVFANLTKFIVWTLPTNFGEGLIILAAILMGVALPLLPVQVLYINMATALLLGLFFVFEPKERDLMEHPPRAPKMPLLTGALMIRIGQVTLVMLVGTFGLFLWEQQQGASLAEARTAAMNVIVMVETFYLFNCRSLTRSMFSVGLFSNRWLLVGVVAMMTAQLVMTYLPLANRLFHTAPLAWDVCQHISGVFGRVSLIGSRHAVVQAHPPHCGNIGRQCKYRAAQSALPAGPSRRPDRRAPP
ncbi:MAG: HAD-IC family P-type ATPase [Phycisphaerae bacterium]